VGGATYVEKQLLFLFTINTIFIVIHTLKKSAAIFSFIILCFSPIQIQRGLFAINSSENAFKEINNNAKVLEIIDLINNHTPNDKKRVNILFIYEDLKVFNEIEYSALSCKLPTLSNHSNEYRYIYLIKKKLDSLSEKELNNADFLITSQSIDEQTSKIKLVKQGPNFSLYEFTHTPSILSH
jgi:hypothetical protein